MRWRTPRVSPAADADLPLPPMEFRQLVGPTDPAAFDNPTGELVYGYLPAAAYDSVFDFGCGCGRFARRLIQQRPRPRRYLGIDLHRGMVEWCRKNLEPHADGFEFRHHDVYYVNFNPHARGRRPTLPFPARDAEFTMIEAWSVFTHLTQSQAEHYLRECARVLRPDGYLHSSWFLFDKRDYAMLAPEQNALYTNEYDLVSAVVFDRDWLRATAADNGLVVAMAIAPTLRGYHWTLVLRPAASGASEVELPEDLAERGRQVAPPMPPRAHRIGLG